MSEKKTNTAFYTFSKIGDSVSGLLKGFNSSQYGLVIQIGDKLVTANKTQLLNIIRDNRKSFKVGKKILIKLVDEKPVKGKKSKNKVKIFTVIHNGVELKANQTFETKNDLMDKSFDILFIK